MDSRWIASTCARWLTVLAPLLFAGAVGCSGDTFDAAGMDASAGDVGSDAPESTITVVPSGGDDAHSGEAGGDAPSQSASPTLDSSVAPEEAAVDGGPCSCTTPHADTSTCDVDGSCLETQCAAGYLDCDGDRSNGCEAEFSTLNCGACGSVCNPSHVNRGTCSDGTCAYNVCSPGYLDCDGDGANGCETPFSPANCGKCGTACQPANVVSASCFNINGGQCSFTSCAPFDTIGNVYLDCDNNTANGCESSPNTNANCGTCGYACTGGSHCALIADTYECTNN